MNTTLDKCLCIIVITLFLSSCKDLMEDAESFRPSVRSILVANRTAQQVYVYRTAEVSEQVEWSFFFHLNGVDQFVPWFLDRALVKISNEQAQSFSFRLSIDSVNGYVKEKYFFNDSLDIRPGERYSLLAKTELGEITGATIVPGDFHIITPINDEFFERVNGRVEGTLRWTQSQLSEGYVVSIRIREPVYGSTSFQSYMVQDTSFSFRFTTSLYAPPDNFAILEIYAFDKNFNNHLEGIGYAGVGGYGCFGSAVLQSVRIRLR